jgi:hypothetical protein
MDEPNIDEYEGYLLFNQIRKLPPEYETSEIARALEGADFSDWDVRMRKHPSEAPNDRLKQVFLPARVLDEPLSKEFFRAMDEDCWWFKYTRQEFETQEGYNDEGELTTIRIPSERSCDIFLTSSGYLLTRGAAREAHEFTYSLISKLQDIGIDGDYDELTFNTDFLMWLIYRYQTAENESEAITINRLTDAKVIGETDAHGRENRVSGSRDITRSAPVLRGILSGKRVSMLGGLFIINNVMLRADIEMEGRIHIKTDKDIGYLEPPGRMIVAVQFADKLCQLYTKWEQGEFEDKYPPSEFFTDTYEDLDTAGVELDFPIDEVLENYQSKWGE